MVNHNFLTNAPGPMTKQADTDAIERAEIAFHKASGYDPRNRGGQWMKFWHVREGIRAAIEATELADLRNKVAELRDTIIGLWHGGKDDRSLHECMGMTWEEYQAWVATHRDDADQSSGKPL